MSIRDAVRQAGQLAIAGFAGHSIPSDLRALAKEFDLGGIILFARNVESPEQVAEIAREAQTLARELPLWVSVDEEGGRVARLRSPYVEGFDLPSRAEIGLSQGRHRKRPRPCTGHACLQT